MSNKRISELGIHPQLIDSDQFAVVNSQETKRTFFSTLSSNVRDLNRPLTASAIQVNGDLNVDGNITVSKLVSASILYESGSTLFGNSMDDTHTFTGSIYVSGSISSPEWIDFELTNNVTPQLGRVWWNPDDKTLDIGMEDGVVLQVGQETHYPICVNGDTGTLLNGTLVMVDPSGVVQGQRLKVVRAITDGTYQADLIVGVVTADIPENEDGYVTWFGAVRDVQKNAIETAGLKDPLEPWVEGNILYPHPTRPGGFTNIKPNAPNLKSTIAVITTINGNNINLLVRPSLGPRIEDINNLQINSLTQGELIMWDSGSNYYKTTTDLSGSYSVTGSVSITQTLNLAQSNPLPNGKVGDLAVSGSNLYFYNGSWTQVV